MVGITIAKGDPTSGRCMHCIMANARRGKLAGHAVIPYTRPDLAMQAETGFKYHGMGTVADHRDWRLQLHQHVLAFSRAVGDRIPGKEQGFRNDTTCVQLWRWWRLKLAEDQQS